MHQPDDTDPEILRTRALMAQAAPPQDITKLPAAEGRRLINLAAETLNDGKPELPQVETFHIAGPGGALRVRLYRPENAAGQGAIYFIHGGGWFACNVDTHDRMLRFLSASSGQTVFSLDYRLSPENIFPAALHDCLAGWQWLQKNAAALCVNPRRIAIAGDSAGANLALALCLFERDAGHALPAASALLYGCFALGIETASRTRFGTGQYGLTGARMDWYWGNYLGGHQPEPPYLATPYHADLQGLPPHYIGIAEYDILADENHMMAQRLAAAGTRVEVEVWPKLTHGCLQMTRDVAAARQAVTSVASALKKVAAF
jgi:acetyl esterase